jgi:hypothetical protein
MFMHKTVFFPDMAGSLFTYDVMTDEVQADRKPAASSGYTMYDFGVHAGKQRFGACKCHTSDS